MKLTTPKYFHYFLACLAFDCTVLLWVSSIGYSLQQILTLLTIWIVSNFLNYPRIVSRRYISYYKLLGSSIRQLVTFILIYLIWIYFVDSDFYKAEILEVWPIFTIFLSRLIFVYILKLYRIKGRGYNRFLIIGETPTMQKLKEKFLADKSHGYILEDNLNHSDIASIENHILNNQLNEIYCSSSEVSQEDISKLLSFTFKYGVNVLVISDNGKEGQNDLEGLPIAYSELNLQKYPLMDQKYLILKRIFDVVFSIFIIVAILSWVIPILGLIILIGSRGPVFFRQPRAGRNGQYFMCLKFRSMRKNSGLRQAVMNDPRVTKIGRFIRKTSIDELPQFINVLFGQMSVVGPRPHIKDLNDKFDIEIDNYNDRILVKPGITGLSQITGNRGETDGKDSMAKRIKTDILYLRNWTLYLDLYIIYKTTLEVVLFKKDINAY